VTVDPGKVIEVVNRFGRLKVLDERELLLKSKRKKTFRAWRKPR